MTKYLGYINTMRGGRNDMQYFNFNILAEVRSDGIHYLDRRAVSDILPDSKYHNVQLRYKDNDYEEEEFMSQSLPNLSLMVWNFEKEHLKYNRNSSRPGYFTYGNLALENGNLVPIWENSIFYMLDEDMYKGDFFNDDYIEILTGQLPGERVYLWVPEFNAYIGNFPIDELGDKLVVYLRRKEHNYLLHGWSDNDVNIDDFHLIDYGAKVDPYPEVEISVLQAVPGAQSLYFDIATDEVLLEEYEKVQGKKKPKYKSELEESLQRTHFFGLNLPPNVREKRISRLKYLLDNVRYSEQVKTGEEIISQRKEISDEMDEAEARDLIVALQNRFPALVAEEKASETLSPLDLLWKEVEAEVQESDRRFLTRDDDMLDFALNKAVIRGQLGIYRKLFNEFQERSNIIRKAGAKMDEIEDLSQIAQAIENSQEKKREIDREIERQEHAKQSLLEDLQGLKNQRQGIVDEIDEVKKQFDNLIERRSQDLIDLTFDSYLASKLTDTLNQSRNQDFMRGLNDIVYYTNDLPNDFKEKNDVLRYLVKTVRIERPGYSKNTILNLFICLFQNLLTVLSGEPGSGKTSISNIMARTLGLDTIENPGYSIEPDRYISIPVEKGWTSKRDLIGYYNPLTKSFDKANLPLYNAFSRLDREKELGFDKYPFIVLLDEANLSPMEYYWSDFMKLTDLEDMDKAIINLGEDFTFQIPETFHFLATVNNDQTTEILSPRLVDRSFIIQLPKPKSVAREGRPIRQDEIRIVPWDLLKKIFVGEERFKSLSKRATAIYKDVLSRFESAHVDVSMRVHQDIIDYWNIAQDLFDKEGDADVETVALDYAVAQKLLPKISGNGESFRKWLEGLIDLFKSTKMKHSQAIVEEILAAGDRDMQYYRFFR